MSFQSFYCLFKTFIPSPPLVSAMMMSFFWLILTLIPTVFLFLFLFKLLFWLNLTLFPGVLDLSAYGGSGRSKRAWALITGASDGIGAAFAKVKLANF